MIILSALFGGNSKDLVFVDFDTRKSLTLNKIRNFHTVNNCPIAVKVTSLCIIEWSFLNKDSITQHQDIVSCFDGLRDSNWMLKEINQNNIFRVLDAEEVEIFAQKYEQWYTPEYDEIDFEFGMANCINLSVKDCLTIGGNFIFNENNINESGRVKGIMDQSEPVRLFFMNPEEKKAANIFLDKRLNSIKDVFIKYDLDINAFHFITNNIYK